MEAAKKKRSAALLGHATAEFNEAVCVDIRSPVFDYDHLKHYRIINLKKEVEIISSSKRIFERVFELLVIALVLATLVGLGVMTYRFSLKKEDVLKKINESARSFSSTTSALQKASYEEANSMLRKNDETLSLLEDLYKEGHGPTLGKIFGLFVPTIREASQLLKSSASLNAHLLSYSSSLKKLDESFLGLLFTNGDELKNQINQARVASREALDSFESVRNRAQSLKQINVKSKDLDFFLEETYLTQADDLESWNAFFEVLSNELERESGIVLNILYYNTRNPRQSGGLIDAFSSLKIKNGQVVDFSTRIPKNSGMSPMSHRAPRELGQTNEKWKLEDLLYLESPRVAARTFEELTKAATSSMVQGGDPVATLLIGEETLFKLLAVANQFKLSTSSLELSENSYKKAREKDYLLSTKKTRFIKSEVERLLDELLIRIKSNPSAPAHLFKKIFYEGVGSGSVVVTSRHNEVDLIFSKLGSKNNDYEPDENARVFLTAPRLMLTGSKELSEKPYIKVANIIHIDANGSILADTKFGVTSANTKVNSNKFYLDIFTNTRTELLSIKNNDQLQNLTKIKDGLHPVLQKEENEQIYLPNLSAWLLDTGNRTKIKILANNLEKTPIEIRTLTKSTIRQGVKSGDTFLLVFEPQRGLEAEVEYRVHAPVGFHFKETKSPLFIMNARTQKELIKESITLEKPAE